MSFCLSDAVSTCVCCETGCSESYVLLKGTNEFVWVLFGYCPHLLSAAGEIQYERYNAEFYVLLTVQHVDICL
jgi:hypothetical protein